MGFLPAYWGRYGRGPFRGPMVTPHLPWAAAAPGDQERPHRKARSTLRDSLHPTCQEGPEAGARMQT